MRRINISGPTFEYDAHGPEGFRSGRFRFGKLIGARRLGATVHELPPGQAMSRNWTTSELHVVDDAGHGGGDSLGGAIVGALARFPNFVTRPVQPAPGAAARLRRR